MFFEKDKYYQYIKTLEGFITAKYIIIITIGILTGVLTKNVIATILSLFISYLITIILTINTKIKIQKMKLDIDIYYYIKNRN